MRCPHAGTSEEKASCKRPCKNLSGLKSHLSKSHGGWSDDQIAAAIAAESQAPTQSRLIDDDSNGDATETLSGAAASPAAAPDAPKRERAASSKSKKASKELSDALDSFKDDFCTMIPPMTAGFLESKFGIVGNLSEKATASVARLWSAYFATWGLEIETETEPTKIPIKGKAVKLLMPLVLVGYTILMMTGVHKVAVKGKEKPKPVPVQPIFTPEQVPVMVEEPPRAE